MSKLTKRMIDALQPRDKDYFEWDDELAGFGVRVWPTGKKTYVAQYRAGKQTRRFKIGSHGALTVEEARKQAKTVLGDVARGEDPQQDRATRRKSLTVKDLCDAYFAAADKGLIFGKRGKPKKSSTLYVDRGRANRHIIPLLGNKLVQDLTTADVVKMMRDVTVGKTALNEKTEKLRGRAIVQGGAGTASQAVTLMSAILTYAASEGIVPHNVARGIQKPAVGRRTRRLTADEYLSLGKVLDASQGEPWQAVAGIKLFLLTGFRLQEIAALKWREVDEAGSCFRLGDSKTGESVRPVGRPVFDVLKSLERIPGNPHVLPSPRKEEGYYTALDTAMVRVTEAARISGVTSHTLRHSYASVAGDLGFTEITISALLGHAAGNVTQRYVHHLDTVLIAAANKVSSEVERMMTGKSAKVIELPRRA
ncbi:tyrosine-type recombinase/integrase [Agrobacterium pusense]|uniref:tyrosine-type recombinase/integrase n=1 Tax=Agrobacterium pusense TaxID=648995 RepID=UPI00088C355F|nr:site-specific integrase [Agrobacterium pusense]MBW9058328.1 integrase arm-type DNA-binding domain-containing protein [Agrobacterium pusense]OOO17176.1 integrase [Agrobacterium pusense]WKD45607.1 site-specific integrase [Agrobacterium pusense]SDF27337.1 Site-specific recombinase XerD [Agrobacterium pusense]